MSQYLQKLKSNLKKELELVQKEDEMNLYNCEVVSCIGFVHGYIVELEQISCTRKNTMKFSEEEKVIVDGKHRGTIVGTELGAIKCTFNMFFKPHTNIQVKRESPNLQFVYKKFVSFLKNDSIDKSMLFFYFRDQEKKMKLDHNPNKPLSKSSESIMTDISKNPIGIPRNMSIQPVTNNAASFKTNMSDNLIISNPKTNAQSIDNTLKTDESCAIDGSIVFVGMSSIRSSSETPQLNQALFVKNKNETPTKMNTILNSYGNCRFNPSKDQLNDFSCLKVSSVIASNMADNHQSNLERDQKSDDKRANRKSFFVIDRMTGNYSETDHQSLTNIYGMKDAYEVDSRFVKTPNISEIYGENKDSVSTKEICSFTKPFQPSTRFENAVEFFNKNLNETQKSAIYKVMEQKSFKIHGPPGTGKTTTLVEILDQLSLLKKTVLVCGPSNASIDNIIQKIHQRPFRREFLRMGSSQKCFPGFEKYNLEFICNEHLAFLNNEIKTLNYEKQSAHKKNDRKKNFYKTTREIESSLYCAKSDLKSKKRQFQNEKILNTELIFSTLYSSLKIEHKTFDWVIIDEFCQGSEIEAILAILKGKNFIIAGDPHQLGPVTRSNLKNRMFENLNIDLIMLDVQYRMSSELIEFSNSVFYDNKIISPTKSNINLFDMSPLIFVDTTFSVAYEENYESSKYNVQEAVIVIRLLSYLEKNHPDSSVGVIVPYSAQVNYIKDNSKTLENKNLQISTVDSFQGQEKDIIVFSLVRNNDSNEIGFLDEIERTNVAITRCKKGLIIICNADNFRKHKFYGKYMHFLENKASVIDSESFLQLLDQ